MKKQIHRTSRKTTAQTASQPSQDRDESGDVAKVGLETTVSENDADSLFRHALILVNEQSAEYNPQEAIKLYERATDLGHPRATFNLGLIYSRGKLVAADVNKARALYEKAAALGHKTAKFNLGVMYQAGRFGKPDFEKAVQYYEELVKVDYKAAMYNLGIINLVGKLGEPNFEKARQLFERAAELGDGESAFQLGLMYKKGLSGQPDLEKARKYYQQAADLDNPTAMFNLALMYRKGELGEVDFQKAKLLYEKAAKFGHAKAINNLATLYESGALGNKDLKRAAELYREASSLGNGRATFNLGMMYLEGDLGVVDKVKAQELFQLAVELGFAHARAFLPNPMITTIIQEFGSDEKDTDLRTEVADALEALEEAFFEIRSAHLIEGEIKLSHFTTWSAIESILNLKDVETPHNCLRQYLVEYMNDPSEGRRLLGFKGDATNADHASAAVISRKLKRLFDDNYFASFERHASTINLLPSVFTVSLTKEADRLDLWRAYGRDGTGYCLVLPFDQDVSADHVRNRSTSLEFLAEDSDNKVGREASGEFPPLYWIRYHDEDVVGALAKIAPPLQRVLDIKSRVVPDMWVKIASCATAILLELLYLYKDEQYSTEKEARALCVMRLDNPRVKLDERTPSYLYCETPTFLFSSSGSEVVLGPKVQDQTAALWNIRYRLTKLGFAGSTVVRKSIVPYR